ncbi:MAG: TonB-dependent receptor [Fibrobacterales bacterium]
MDLLKVLILCGAVVSGFSQESFVNDTIAQKTNVNEISTVDFKTLNDTPSIKADSVESGKNRIMVTGTLLNSTTGEGYVGQSIVVGESGIKVTTDEDGFFELSAPREDSLTFYLMTDTLYVEQSTFAVEDSIVFLNVLLKVGIGSRDLEKPDSVDMVVVAERGAIHDRKKVSSFKVTRSEMQEMAASMGDPMRVISSMPGVTSQSDLSVRSFVRGGKAEEMRVFWNDVPLLQPYHMGTIFSIFNMEHIDNAELFTGNLPIGMNNALSAALVTENRTPPKDSLEGYNELSTMRNNIYVGSPITKRISADISFQYFHWDWFFKRTGDFAMLMAGDEDTEEDWEKAKKFFAIPTFLDIQAGIEFEVNEKLSISYRGLYASDWFYVLDPIDMIEQTNGDTMHLDSIDTLAYVGVDNWVHTVNANYLMSENWKMRGSVAYQSQKWNIQFGDTDADNIFTDPKFDLERSTFHLKFDNVYSPNENHVVNFGASFDLWMQEYNAYIIRPMYELFVNGSYDVVKMLGMDEPEGIVITEEDGIGGVSDVLGRIRFDHVGSRSQQFYALYGGDKWNVNDDLRLEFGLRLEYGNGTSDLFPSPRAAVFKRLDESNELTISAGLYSQNDIPYFMLDQNPHLQSEKNIMGEFEWSHDFNTRYRFEWRTYGKYYFDLVASQSTKHPLPKTKNELIETIRHLYKTLEMGDIVEDEDIVVADFLQQFDMSDEAIEQFFTDSAFVPYDLRSVLQYTDISYENSGVGYAVGSELIFRYDPTKVWRGWISAELSTSKRKDDTDGMWYNFSDYRPYQIKWHNYFNMSNDWEIAFRYTYAGGKAYTPYDEPFSNDFMNRSDTVLVIGKKNSRWYNVYERLDISLAQNSTFFGLPSRTYFEVWNAFNVPNFFLRDSETNKLVSIEPNLPFPTIFFGWQLRW